MEIPDRYARYYLENTPSLVWLLVVNSLAILVGIRFYVETMPEVPTFLWPLYVDSPMALALVTASFLTLLPNLGNRLSNAPQNLPLAYLHTFAFVWLVKFGIWTFVALNLGFSAYFGPPWNPNAVWDYWGIVITHLAFVVEAFLIPHYGRTTRGALVAALGVALASDVLDYGFGFHPPLRYEPGVLLPLATVVLSVVSVLAADRAFERLE
ncbi:DUF1405 domain-containing protein [Haladaptatus caseinilyticus]|uniref:DUF1405 domain-containing protein n=1 Tax=Haladaptatus caseinilyticus TaxID=2993314 RepID=UPI00224B9FD8|nr:DUF1405 domain-containing protein [Haladaptatus caseinilyticus]